MIDIGLWVSIIFGMSILITRRRNIIIALLAFQTLVITGEAAILAQSRSSAFLLATIVLCGRAIVLTLLLFIVSRRVQEEPGPRTELDPLMRLAMILLAVVLVNLLIPPLGILSIVLQRGCLTVLITGLGIVIVRHGTLVQLVGILVAENALALLAISVPGGMPILIEIGAASDLILLTSVALTFHTNISRLWGTTNTSLLRDLHD